MTDLLRLVPRDSIKIAVGVATVGAVAEIYGRSAALICHWNNKGKTEVNMHGKPSHAKTMVIGQILQNVAPLIPISGHLLKRSWKLQESVPFKLIVGIPICSAIIAYTAIAAATPLFIVHKWSDEQLTGVIAIAVSNIFKTFSLVALQAWGIQGRITMGYGVSGTLSLSLATMLHNGYYALLAILPG